MGKLSAAVATTAPPQSPLRPEAGIYAGARCKFNHVYLHTCFGTGGESATTLNLAARISCMYRLRLLQLPVSLHTAAACPARVPSRLDIWSRGAHSSPAWTRNAPCACLHRRRRRWQWRSSPAPHHPWAALAAAEEAYWYANAHSRSSHRDTLNHIKMLTQSVAFFRQQRAGRSLSHSLVCVIVGDKRARGPF